VARDFLSPLRGMVVQNFFNVLHWKRCNLVYGFEVCYLYLKTANSEGLCTERVKGTDHAIWGQLRCYSHWGRQPNCPSPFLGPPVDPILHTSCGGTSKDTVRRSTLVYESVHGRMKKSPAKHIVLSSSENYSIVPLFVEDYLCDSNM